MQHCISALKRRKEEEGFRYYVTDMLWAIVKRNRDVDIPRFCDVIHPKNEEEEKTEEEVISSISGKLANMRGFENA